jgi:hypothetical protein
MELCQVKFSWEDEDKQIVQVRNLINGKVGSTFLVNLNKDTVETLQSMGEAFFSLVIYS